MRKTAIEKRGLAIGSDRIIALGLAGAVFLFHALHVSAVAKGAIFQKSNLAFDFDIQRFAGLWCTSPFPEGENEAYYAVRHPLAVSIRLLCMPLVSAGADPVVTACLFAALCAAISTALIYKIARVLEVQPIVAAAFAMLWSVSTTTLLLGVLPEAYGLALVALSYQALLSVRWEANDPPSFVARAIAAVANFGITITNVLFSGLAELLGHVAHEPLKPAVSKTIRFGVIAGIVAIVLSGISLVVWPSKDIDSAENAARQVYWSANSYDAQQRQNLPNVAWEFGVSSFVAPAAARYPSENPDNPYLWDLRGQNYGIVGWAAVVGWLALLGFGAFSAAQDRKGWPLWALCGAWIAFNIVLHNYWQFRGSIFVYTAHPHTAFLMLALAGARRTQHAPLYAGAVGLVTILAAFNNAALYLALPELN